ncbi:WD40 repeat-like protein [Exidia glandulosa HHB12029]|uniref:WD40 repeat-like protein n=1 Tax=Exidia glandulosa HHB12029 TaxID=1314781 RepID=A0A165CWU9_EXIGL|nr:WD40 repeat-like protein [Exidia glandulosa HHB12029]KZV83324.1 WD40 repeat-like protein [Exidia glandulosa HHB12029]
MPDPFFANSKGQKRRRGPSNVNAKNKKPRTGTGTSKNQNQPPAKRRRRDEELDSDGTQDDDNVGGGGLDDLDLRHSDSDAGASGEEDEHETPAEKRLRLAKLYIDSLKKDIGEGEVDAAEIDKEILSVRLKQDVQESSGKLSIFIADKLNTSTYSKLRVKGHKLSVTCAVASEDGTMLFTAGKEGGIVKWDLLTGKELARFPKLRKDTKDRKGKGRADPAVEIKGHTDEVLALALSSDGKYLASGGRDRLVCIWDAQKGEWLRAFGGHRDAISSLSFRKDSLQLYSASFDRTIRLFDLAAMGYVETLFGHQDCIQDMDTLRAETAVSVGGRDRTVRYWKVPEESQLVFRGGRGTAQEILENGLDEEPDAASSSQTFVEGSLDCVAMIDETSFVSGGDSGSICLWSTAKKKPVFTLPLAHGLHEHHSETEGIVLEPRWISALACLRYADVVVSGSSDGFIRLWKVDSKLRSLTACGSIPCPGVVNSLRVVSPRSFFSGASWLSTEAPAVNGRSAAHLTVKGLGLVAGVGQEPKFGRWRRLKGDGVSNCAFVFTVPLRGAEQ